MSTTNIEWADRVWNPVTGCTKVSPGCKHCYAEGVAHRFWHHQYVHIADRGFIPVKAYAGEPMTGMLRRFTDVMTHADRLLEPLSWRKPARVFVNSMSDLFHEDVPFEFIDQVFAVMALASQHTFQVLTKRPDRMQRWFQDSGRDAVQASMAYPQFLPANGRSYPRVCSWPLLNVWLGVSVEDQQRADKRIPLLLQTPAAVRFISAEPLLGPVDFLSIPRSGKHHDYLTGEYQCSDLEKRTTTRLDWVIVGGESGRGARPFHVEWAKSIVAQCKAAGVACFVKQLGADPRWGADGWKLDMLRDRKGGDISEWPDYYVGELRVREFPR